MALSVISSLQLKQEVLKKVNFDHLAHPSEIGGTSGHFSITFTSQYACPNEEAAESCQSKSGFLEVSGTLTIECFMGAEKDTSKPVLKYESELIHYFTQVDGAPLKEDDMRELDWYFMPPIYQSLRERFITLASLAGLRLRVPLSSQEMGFLPAPEEPASKRKASPKKAAAAPAKRATSPATKRTAKPKHG